MSLAGRLEVSLFLSGLHASRDAFNPLAHRAIPRGVDNPLAKLDYIVPVFEITAHPDHWQTLDQDDRQKLHHEKLAADLREATTHLLQQLGRSEYGMEVATLLGFAQIYDHLDFAGYNTPVTEEVRTSLQKVSYELEAARLHHEAELAIGSLKPAFDDGFRLTFGHKRPEQLLVKAIPDNQDSYWLISSTDGLGFTTKADRASFSVTAVSYEDGLERSIKVDEPVTLQAALENYPLLQPPENSRFSIATWSDLPVKSAGLTR
jgi:hypothetical protein